MTDLALFRRWKRQLRRHFPSAYPVRVLLVPPEALREGPRRKHCTDVGDTWFDAEKQRFTIRIANNMNWGETQSWLFHEWSHVLRDHLETLSGDGDHDDIWAAILGRINRVWLEEV